MNDTKAAPRIYCGTYAKYNDGNLFGKWLDLEDYADADDFLEACKELHKDEADPELMFQDFEGFPKSLYSESPDKERLEKVINWANLDESEREIVAAYWDQISEDADQQEALDAYTGTYSSEADWAEEFLKDTGTLERIPQNLRMYFDFEAYARDCRMNGDVTFVECTGGDVMVFNNT
jgi:antirestriction protein